MPEGISLVCPRCGRMVSSARGRCPEHDEVLDLSYDIPVLREQFDRLFPDDNSLWRYGQLLPVDETSPVTLGEGWTDLVTAPGAGEEIGVDLDLKLEGANPTGSAKDRGSAVLVTHAVQQGYEATACASTGNAAASIAAYAARGGLDCSLFVPERVPDAKAVQPLVHDASLVTVDGGYGMAAKRCRAVTEDRPVVDRTAGAHPLTAAGGQTLGFELAVQAENADWIAVSMGNGGTIADLWDGIALFAQLGYLSETPRMLGVQAAGAPAIHDRESSANPTGTCADSIDVDEPRRGADARRAIEESEGTTLTVDDEQIRRWLRGLGKRDGVFAEPASAAAVAGVAAAVARGDIDRGEQIVAVMTGSGLKDTATALDAVDSA